MNVRVWVTGASGMLGKVLAAHLRQEGWTAEALSRTGRESTTALDLSDFERTAAHFRQMSPELVIHSAAYSDVDGCERDPQQARAANALSTQNLSRLCAHAGVPLIYVSTDYVFSGRQTVPYRETDETFPVNIYGLTKLEGESYARGCAAGGAVVRTSWLFGAPNSSNFVNAILNRLRSEKEVSVLDDQTDCPTSVRDLSRGLTNIARRLLQKRGGPVAVYHLCNQGPTTRLEMTRFFQQELKLKTVVKRADRAAIQGRMAVRPAHCVMSCERYQSDFGETLRPWQDAAREYILGQACAS